MRNNAVQTAKYLIVSIYVALAVASSTVSAQEPPILPDGNKIEGTWNMQVQWRNCDDGQPMLLPTPDLRSFAAGGVTTVIDSSIWCDLGHCTSLGVWKHLGGRRYVSTYKRSRLSSTGQYTGYVIFISNITHEADDTLTTSDFLRFYEPDGSPGSSRCRTATGARFTGEN